MEDAKTEILWLLGDLPTIWERRLGEQVQRGTPHYETVSRLATTKAELVGPL